MRPPRPRAVRGGSGGWPNSILIDQGHQDDPHLWQRARELGLDLDHFERDRRSDEVAERVRRDFHGGVRAGVTGTPAAFLNGRLLTGDVEVELASA